MNNEYKLLCKRFQGLSINPVNSYQILLRMVAGRVATVAIPDGARMVRFINFTNNSSKAFTFNFNGKPQVTVKDISGGASIMFTNQRYTSAPLINGRSTNGWYSCLGKQSIDVLNSDASVKIIGIEFIV